MMGNNPFEGNANADTLLAEISFLLQSNKKNEATKLYRKMTGASHFAARKAIKRIEMGAMAGTFSANVLPLPADPLSGAARPAFAGLDEMAMFEIGRLLTQGKKIEAIKLYRQITGVGLKEARDAIDRLEMAAAAGTLAANMASFAVNSSPGDSMGLDETTMLEIGRLLAQSKKIEAIKLYRQVTGVGLSEAKENVDRLEQSMHQQGF